MNNLLVFHKCQHTGKFIIRKYTTPMAYSIVLCAVTSGTGVMSKEMR